MLSLKSPPEIAVELAVRIRAKRLQKGWTQAELAARAGLKEPTYVLFERSGRISLLRLLKVFELFGLADEFDQIGRKPDYANTTLDDLLKPQRQRGRRRKS